MKHKFPSFLILLFALFLASCGGGGGDTGDATGTVIDEGGGGGGTNQTNWTAVINNAPLEAMASSPEVTVAVGDGGFIKTSPDGAEWTIRNSGTTWDLNDVVWSGTKFVVVGDTGTVLTSTDGISWTTTNSGINTQINGLAWSPDLSQFVAVGDGIFTSPDGVSWTVRASDNIFSSVIWTGSKYIAVSGDDSLITPGVVLTSADGIDWVDRSAGISAINLFAVSASPNQVVIVGEEDVGDYAIWASSDPDVSSWQIVDPLIPMDPCYDVTWAGDQFVAVGGMNDSVIKTSTDGIAWTDRSFPPTSNSSSDSINDFGEIVAVNWSGTKLMAVSQGDGMGHGGMIITSPTGETWTMQSPGTEYDLQGITWTGSQYVAVGAAYQPGNTDWSGIYTSTDGSDWTRRDVPTDDILRGIASSSDTLVAVGNSGVILVSHDGGINWAIARAGELGQHLDDVIWSGTQFLAVGGYTGTGPALILTSPDGTTWTPRNVDYKPLWTITWSGNQFVAGGWFGTILTSPDGIEWTLRSTPRIYESFRDIVWTGTQFVAVGEAGTIQTSPDGIDWTLQEENTNNCYYGLTWTGSQLVAVGTIAETDTYQPMLNTGLVRTSYDGVTWTDQVRGGTNLLNKVTAGSSGKLVAVGAYGLVITSP